MYGSVTEAEACRWLGRRVSLLVGAAEARGRIEHVSSRKLFLVDEERRRDAREPALRAILLAHIERISSADGEEAIW